MSFHEQTTDREAECREAADRFSDSDGFEYDYLFFDLWSPDSDIFSDDECPCPEEGPVPADIRPHGEAKAAGQHISGVLKSRIIPLRELFHRRTAESLIGFTGALLLLISVQVTFSYLFSVSEPVTNTFNPNNIALSLTESGTNDPADTDNDSSTNIYRILPGEDIAKDPVVTVGSESMDCYLFVKVECSSNFGAYMSYDIGEGWIACGDGVYYRTVAAADSVRSFPVLSGNTVSVRAGVTEDNLRDLEAGVERGDMDYPTMTNR